MISDTLSDAVESIRGYLTHKTYEFTYSDPDLRAHILKVVDEMDSLRASLDASPSEMIPKDKNRLVSKEDIEASMDNDVEGLKG